MDAQPLRLNKALVEPIGWSAPAIRKCYALVTLNSESSLAPLLPNHYSPILAEIAHSPITTETPFFFLAYGFALLLVVFLLMNVDRRFREYLSRSLVRPYNFFADIRDQRIIPNVQTTLLAIAEAGAVALYFASVIFVFSPGFMFRNSAELNILVRTMAPVPGETLTFLSVAAFVKILLTTVLMRFAAIFVKRRIYLSDTFNVVTWSLLPLVILLPFDLILPRLDPTGATLTFMSVVFGVLVLWVYQRLMKGIGVLFDVYPTVLYLYGTLILAVVVGAAWVYLA